MRPPTLQYFYLERPMLLLIAICLISILLWTGRGSLASYELEEVHAATSLLEGNNWLLPKADNEGNVYKSPLVPWVIAVFSLPGGEVTPLTARLPSTLAFICMVCFSFVFFGKNVRFQDAFLSALILITSYTLHRSSMISSPDMCFAFFVVLGLQRLFRWEERKALKGFPITATLMLGLAGLTKGLAGVFLPVVIFSIYLLVLQYKWNKVLIKMLPVLLGGVILPLVWYIVVHSQLNGNNLILDNENNLLFAYSFSILIGFLPWTILMVMSLFGLKYSYIGKKTLWKRIKEMEKINLFSLITILVILIFYCFPMYRSQINLIIVYPFIAIFMAKYILYLTEYQVRTNRTFALIIGLGGIGLIFFWIGAAFIPAIHNLPVLHTRIYHFLLIGVLFFSIGILAKHLWKKSHLKVLYSAIGVYLAIQLAVDGIFLHSY
ncbi:MAG: glycosyltransferase family 39 protein [Bacteroidales bacterium]|nr:glycosyltransferase family 39 protein [Bacteroidales bacterium]